MTHTPLIAAPLARSRLLAWLAAFSLGALLCAPAAAQLLADDPDWRETEVPPPPAFSTAKLITFDVSVGSQLVFGFDPQTMKVFGDGLVRYVMVASSKDGSTSNVFYEAIRCTTAEYKLYARHSKDGGWNRVENPEWKKLYDFRPARHALQLARQGLCDGNAVAGSVDTIIRRVRDKRVEANP